MLVFSTKLPLNSNIKQENCLKQFIDWVTKSDHYPIDEITYDISSHEDYNIKANNVTFSITHFKDETIELSACRLENRENDAVWFNDCIFLCENGNKSLLIQLNCNRLNFNATLPLIHKPYIVRQFVDSGFCKDDASIPIASLPLIIDDLYLDICAKIMRCESKNSMPVVYISRNYKDQTVIAAETLAKQLGGVAHVMVESNRSISFKLKDAANGRNVHNGYIGIYFPGSTFCERFNIDDFNHNSKLLIQAIINSVWSALINRIDSSIYNWHQIMMLKSRQKMLKWKDASISNKEELKKFMDSFDTENDELRKKVKELNDQNDNLRIQLDNMRYALQSNKENMGFYKLGKEHDLYPGEHVELLYSILSQVQQKYDATSRPYCLIQSLLSANKPIGECARILGELKALLRNTDRLTESCKSKLKDLGFSITEEGKHYKLTFHDARYMFTISKTPSEFRGGKNLYSDICKRLDINKKYNS